MGKRVVVIEGEDAAPEAVRPVVALVDRLVPDIEWIHPLVGDDARRASGSAFPEAARGAIESSDATLFGATDGRSAEAFFFLRWGMQTWANVRPARWFPGCVSPLAAPEEVDFVIVRENLEDLYAGVEGKAAALHGLDLHSVTWNRPFAELGDGRFAIKLITEERSRRIVQFAFDLARKRKADGHPGRVTAASKHNILYFTDGLFHETAQQVAQENPDVEFGTLLIDDFAHRMIASPGQFDVVVMPNLYGDILSDAASALVGGLGLCASGCYGDEYAYFESIHGTAPDLVGKNTINPTATLLSATMMLEYLGFADAARAIVAAIERVYAVGDCLTPDQGGRSGTEEFCAAIGTAIDA